jgi:glucose/arabinose dehydrogenase
MPFLDITSKVTFVDEMGLLGMAFHPSYASNSRFYINYVRGGTSAPQTVIAEYQAQAGNPDLADPASERILLTVNQPFTNHKGGQLTFGADGFLYIGLGDGGGAGDPNGNGQSLATLLGKLLRIDVDHTSTGRQYAIPADNPFAGGGGLPEIWAYGFRNPWRFSFDSSTGRLFAGDVGQDKFEEVNLVERGGNFGWNTMEGLHCYTPATGCNMAGLVMPIIEYGHSEGEAVIGGYVYRGSAIPDLVGSYIMADFESGTLWMASESAGIWTRTQLLSTGRNISSLGQDALGEIHVVDYNGSVLKVEPQ